MSMYTQPLDAALHQLPIGGSGEEPWQGAEARRRRSQLERGTADVDPDTVSAALAVQIGYDVALLRLAELMRLESDPSRFDRPQDERTRLEVALAERGISLREIGAGSEPVARGANRSGPQVPVASQRVL